VRVGVLVNDFFHGASFINHLITREVSVLAARWRVAVPVCKAGERMKGVAIVSASDETHSDTEIISRRRTSVQRVTERKSDDANQKGVGLQNESLVDRLLIHYSS
jgi:hypothetical protein